VFFNPYRYGVLTELFNQRVSFHGALFVYAKSRDPVRIAASVLHMLPILFIGSQAFFRLKIHGKIISKKELLMLFKTTR
ncbi:hypothetical protein, partial [Limosilactobacillus mucosae]|uniref:hypothetical protein n=1 Tax=Limosilactobacillus mucosae TaxID=97478 RepID=UPI003991DEE3